MGYTTPTLVILVFIFFFALTAGVTVARAYIYIERPLTLEELSG